MSFVERLVSSVSPASGLSLSLTCQVLGRCCHSSKACRLVLRLDFRQIQASLAKAISSILLGPGIAPSLLEGAGMSKAIIFPPFLAPGATSDTKAYAAVISILQGLHAGGEIARDAREQLLRNGGLLQPGKMLLGCRLKTLHKPRPGHS